MRVRNSSHIISIFLIIILINIIANYVKLDIDLTKDKKHSISSQTKEIVKNLDDQIFFKVYLEGDLPSEFKYLRSSIYSFLKNLKDISPVLIDFEFIDPNLTDENKKNTLTNQLFQIGLLPTDLQLKQENKRVSQRIFPGAIVYYKDKKIPINFLKNTANLSPSNSINQSVENLEYEFLSAILKITKEKLEKIAFLEGNGELDPQRVYDISYSVMQDNFNLSYYFDVERFNIKEFFIDSITMEQDIARQIKRINKYKTIIIAKPTIAFNDLDKFIIDQYVMNGGKILWLVDGVRANMDSLKISGGSFIALQNNLNISDQLFRYGVRINADLIEDLRSAEIPIVTGYSNNMPQQDFFTWPYYPILYSERKHILSRNIDGVLCDFTSSIDLIKNDIKKTILLESSKNSRLLLTPAQVSLQILRNPPPQSNYNQGRKIIAVLLEGNFESVFKNRILPKEHSKINFLEKSIDNKMIVISDGDLIANKVSEKGNIYPLGYDSYRKYIDAYPGNKYFLINAIQYLCDNNQLNIVKSKQLTLRLLDKKKIKESRYFIELINILLPLALLIIFFIFYIIFDKKRYA